MESTVKYCISRRELYEIYKQKRRSAFHIKQTHVIDTVHQQLQFSAEEDSRKATETLKRLCAEFQRRINAIRNSKVPLEHPNSPHFSWMNEKLNFQPAPPKTFGRPPCSFDDASLQTKKRRVLPLAQQNSTKELALATELSARAEGLEDAAKLVNAIFQGTPETASNIRNLLKLHDTSPPLKNYTAEEALALFVHLDLGKDDYLYLRSGMVARNLPDMLPSYQKLQEAADQALPDITAITVSESHAEVQLQALLDHTAKRIILPHETAFLEGEMSDEGVEIAVTMHTKYGFDGSSGHSKYKQKYNEKDSHSSKDDGSIFLTCIVPLQVSKGKSEDLSDTDIVWKNPCPASTRFCRPVSFSFQKETSALTTEHYEKLKTSINALVPTRIHVKNVTIVVHHCLFPCMVDGKICSALASTASSNCHVCGAKPSQMNELSAILKRTPNKSTYQFGLSPLHARIRCLEMILHLAYRIKIQSWRATTAAHKQSVEEEKRRIQETFRVEMGLLLDCVKQGHGTTNDGNSARRFFRDPEKAAEITGVDEELISRLAIILEVLSCGLRINVPAFRVYCLETAEVYNKNYSWYYMPQSVHKLLIHGADIIESFPLPVGTLTEEAQESRNKDLRNFRERHTRKCSRSYNNWDLIKRLLLTSDPYISSICQPRVNFQEPSAEMKKLLL